VFERCLTIPNRVSKDGYRQDSLAAAFSELAA
jgi:hypothetical protein